MSRKKIVIAVIVLIVLAAAAGALFYFKKGSAAGGAGMPGATGAGRTGAGAQQSSYAMVRASVPSRGDVSVTSSLTGTVAAADVVYVYAKTSGDVTAVRVKAGDYVKEGDLICTIDTNQVDSVKNQLDSAEISLNNARSNLERMEILHGGGDITDQEYEQYKNNVKTAELQYDTARLNYETQLSYSSVTAPISGRIESCSVGVYDHVNNNAELCVIAGEGKDRIDFYVSERMLQALSEGDSLEVIKNGTSYQGKLTEISTIVDSATGLFKCKAELEETSEIAIGSSVKLKLVTDRASDAMLVPVDAIYYSGGKGYVYVVVDGKAAMRGVKVGLYDDTYAEILEGLSEDDLVVGTWSSNLYDGANVRLMGEEQDGAQGQPGEMPAGAAPDGTPAGGQGQGGAPAGGRGQSGAPAGVPQ